MPPTPKSSTKKDKFLWYNCAKCNITICHTNLESHELDCEMKTDFISGETYNTSIIQSTLPAEIDEKDAQKLYLQRFVFIPESICSFCKMTQGCNVLIETGNQKIVKKLWTINDKHLNSVYCNSEDLKIDNNACDKKVVISKLLAGNYVKICSKIELLMFEKLDDTRDIERLLKAQLKNTIVHQSNTIVLEFINKRIKFQIKSITKSSEDDIITQFSQIQLSEDMFYLIDSVTSILIAGNFKSESQLVEKKPKYSLDQVGGLDLTVQDLKKTLDLALGAVTNDCSMKISRGVLIYGLSGCGKTLLCHALANSYNVHKIQIDSWKIFSKYYGESEANLKKCFQEGFDRYPNPTIIIIDELFNICPKNDNSDAVKRVSTLLVSLLDSLHTKRDGSRIFVLANTSNIDNVDPTIRRSGRLDFEVEIPVPNAAIREQILIKLLVKHNLNEKEIKQVAKHTHGYVGADLENLLAKSITLEKRNGSFSALLQFQDVIQNLNQIKPSAMRELLIEKPDVKWSDIGGQTDLKLKLKQIVEWPINHPETFERLGIKPPRGLLMFGPPGCSKTMIAKALATESNLNFISIKGSDLFSMWVGESEKAVRELFVKARQLSPCIVFFDEIDAIGGERSSDSGSSVKERVLAQILTEIDGVHTLKNVIIIAATNRPDLIDKALMRPGRLDRIVYVQLPDAETRREIFRIKLSKIPIGKDVDLEILVCKTDGHSGAEIEAICKEAALKALEHSFDIEEIGMEYFDHAIELVRPRTSKELLELYDMYLKSK